MAKAQQKQETESTIPGIKHPELFAQKLLGWYDAGHRQLPFRLNPVPYCIWISEIMAQQTRMEALLPYYERFIQQFPDLAALAAADEDALMKVWQGLGYYSRARKLQACARVCMEQYDGKLPDSYEQLLELPGIGPYTAGAIASIAFGQPVPAVDGNVIRVFSRITALQESISPPKIQKQIRQRMKEALPERPGDYNQALMELGALVCLPKNPKCGICPVQALCLASEQKIQSILPIKEAKKPRTIEKKPVYILASRTSRILHLIQRPDTGLLAGLYGFDEKMPYSRQISNLHMAGPLEIIPLTSYKHVFTHKEWHMDGWLIFYEPTDAAAGKKPAGFDRTLQHYLDVQTESEAGMDENRPLEGVWVSFEQAQDYAIPSAFKPFYEQAMQILLNTDENE